MIRVNSICHPDWVKLCVDPNGRIKLRAKQKYEILSATYIYRYVSVHFVYRCLSVCLLISLKSVLIMTLNNLIAQSGGAIEYTD